MGLSIQKKLMGSAFSLGVYHLNPKQSELLLNEALHLIEDLETQLSEFLPESTTSLINKSKTGIAIPLPLPVFNLLQRCEAISKLSNGDFDITVAPFKKLYNFKQQDFSFPSVTQLRQTAVDIGFQHLELNENDCSVTKHRPGMQISFAAIGKGYASDMVIQSWKKQGIPGGYVSAAGDLHCFGLKDNGDAQNIGIAHPDKKGKFILMLPLQEGAVATSGDAEQFFEREGKRFSHNINPHTGMPLQHIKSVSVISPSAELSDALATAVYVKGNEVGIQFIEQLPQTHAVIIDEHLEISLSKNLTYEIFT